MSEWVVTAPAPAGVFDGIGDYASRLAAALGATAATRVVVYTSDVLPAPGEVAGVLHQYSPHSESPELDGWLKAVHTTGAPIVMTIHEYWPPASWSPRRMLVRRQQRDRLTRLLALASAVVVTQDIYARELRDAGVCEGKPIHVIPAGSNITRDRAEQPRTGGLVMFGQPASFQPAHLAAVATWLAGPNRPRLTWIARSHSELQRAWHEVGGTDDERITLTGGAEESSVSQILLRATVGLAPYANGASGKRTTLAALLQHGVPTVATTGIATDPWLLTSGAVRTVPQTDPCAFVQSVETLLHDAAARAQLSAQAEQLFAEHLAWPRLAERYRAVMTETR